MMYCSRRGVHSTPATRTLWAISEKSRPRFTPRMVTCVPPSGGPDTVRIWRETKHSISVTISPGKSLASAQALAHPYHLARGESATNFAIKVNLSVLSWDIEDLISGVFSS